ncbi:LysR family transcriptional regulator [Pseudoduganella aquatica]|uniref:LysR family transcriptional regulator n=1 Tax=Pseudoduganella aquatica TaxID=2660641 RepID=A0A7X4KPD3_9BURK|nr:LysR family transcriptional regulator [Pseudoduganella aquatica]MYN09790.1 LysR family transcriptional regulator [Pseudoduganella aquatica]
MNIDRLDLNLLRVFNIVYEERNLQRASRRLNLSHSAISHALGRLREALGDELFVRTAGGMQPTARAQAMAAPLRNALLQISGALGNEPFAPATAQRDFVIAATDYVTLLLLERLSAQLQELAPLANLVIRPSTRIDLAGQLDLGRIDVAIGVFADIPPRFSAMTLWTQTDTLSMRPGHPLAGRKVTAEDLATYPLIAVSLGGVEEGAVDGFLSERGLARESDMFDRAALPETARLRMLVPHSLAVPSLLRSSDMLAVLPSSLSELFAEREGLPAAPLPYPARSRQMQAIWHNRSDSDPALTWLRSQISR